MSNKSNTASMGKGDRLRKRPAEDEADGAKCQKVAKGEETELIFDGKRSGLYLETLPPNTSTPQTHKFRCLESVGLDKHFSYAYHTITRINELEIDGYDHILVAAMIQDEFGDLTITVKKRHSEVKLQIKFSIGANGKFTADKLKEEEVKADKADDVDGLFFTGVTENKHLLTPESNQKALKWCEGSDALCLAPVNDKWIPKQYIFKKDQYQGIDTVDNETVFTCSFRAFQFPTKGQEDRFVYASKTTGKLQLLPRGKIDVENKLINSKPLLFKENRFCGVSFFESLAYEGWYIAWNSETCEVYLKNVGKPSTGDLEGMKELKFLSCAVTPLKETSL